MKDIFRLGDHTICGISLTYIEFKKLYQFIITLLLVHLTLHIGVNGFRIGISIGDKSLYLRIQLGLD